VEDTYAVTLAAQVFRAIMAITAAFDLEIRQYNTVNAFVNAHLPTPILCNYAEGFERNGFMLWLTKALYGLKTSAVFWYRDFTATLEKLGLKPVPDANCLYFNDWLMIIFYVDDIIAIYD
jgi:Reverse transcriptase (RNA-dependent DNA polymerase)